MEHKIIRTVKSENGSSYKVLQIGLYQIQSPITVTVHEGTAYMDLKVHLPPRDAALVVDYLGDQ